MRIIGTAAILLGSLAIAGECLGIAFPTARWFFETSRDVPWLHYHLSEERVWPWFGWLSTAALLAGGLFLMLIGHVISDVIVAMVDPRIKFE